MPRRHGGPPAPAGGGGGPKGGGKPKPPVHHHKPQHHTAPKHPKKPAKLSGPAAGGLPLFGNDIAEVCAPAAAALSLLLVTGRAVPVSAVTDLYVRAGGRDTSGVYLEDLAAELQDSGLAGLRPAVAELHPGEPYQDGAVLDLSGHAAVFWAGAVLLWGSPAPAPEGLGGLVLCWEVQPGELTEHLSRRRVISAGAVLLTGEGP